MEQELNGRRVRPPRWADKLLARFTRQDRLEETIGDLQEAFYQRCREHSVSSARRRYILDVLLSLSFKPHDHQLTNSAMLTNYLTSSIRNMMQNKLFSFINISGLAIGMAACFLIMQYNHFEWSFDQFHKNKDRIYRVVFKYTTPTGSHWTAANHPAIGPSLKNNFPEVEEFARMVPQTLFMGDVTTWTYSDPTGNRHVFNEDRVYCVDPVFLTLFNFPMLYGDPSTALKDPLSVVLTERESNKFFGSENPIGKTLTLDGWKAFTVTGVLKDIPQNSHIHFDVLVSYFLYPGKVKDMWTLGGIEDEGNWKWAEFYTYVRLSPNADLVQLEKKLNAYVEEKAGDFHKRMQMTEAHQFQLLTDIHLRSVEMTKEREVHGSERSVYFLTIIAILILVIAWINYVNLSTSKAVERAREVGVRKVAGAYRIQLIVQFLMQSALFNVFAIVLSFLLIAVFLKPFNQLLGRNMGDSVFQLPLLREPYFWMALSGIFVFGSLIAGLYPSWTLSSFRIVEVLKGKRFQSAGGINIRKALVASQFVISVALIAGTIIVYRQVAFMQNQEPGYAKNELLVIKSPRIGDSTFLNRARSFRNEIERRPGVQGMTYTSEIPGRMISQMNNMRKYGEGRANQFVASFFNIDESFLATYHLTLIAGRNYTSEDRVQRLDDQRPIETIPPAPILLNEDAVRRLGYSDPRDAVNQQIYYGMGSHDWIGKIVGVVGNHHQRSLRQEYDPIIFLPSSYGEYITINVGSQNLTETVGFIGDQFKTLFPGNQFDYFFLDDYFNRQYASDRQFEKVFGLFAGLALFVAGLGLFGLSTFMITQRLREIAIRKVLGASVQSVILLLSADFIKLIIIANAIALPAAYWVTSGWLKNFAFRTSIGWTMFVIPGVVLLSVSIATIGIQLTRTGLINPAQSLKTE